MLSLDVIDPTAADAPARMDSACRELGFFRIPADLVADGIVKRASEAATAFFDQPVSAKDRYGFPVPGHPYGYSPFKFENLAAPLGDVQSAPDLKESFSVGPDCLDIAFPTPTSDDEVLLRSPSQWPDTPEGFRQAWVDCFRALSEVSEDLLSVMAVALDLDPNYFVPLIDRPCSAMRALNYPALDGPPGLAADAADAADAVPGILSETAALRAGAHSDYGTVTILITDDVPGLEVQHRDGTWQSVAHVPDTYVVNLGDSIAQWTNDRWRSTLHRVTTVSAERRQSMAFFHTANWDATIACLDTCHGPENPIRYEPVQAGPWLMRKFTASIEPLASFGAQNRGPFKPLR